MLIRCSKEESRRIRAAAQMEDVTISAFVLRCLRLSWKAAEDISNRTYGLTPRRGESNFTPQE
jgi:uncharacterized protein (DUF1778 family)